jgi:nitroimidazol reductase NimA-like FMN-containing flavoprotein (pyridoxamine 5'-phosphate oxidase superfamily)
MRSAAVPSESRLIELDEQESLELLQKHARVGRIAFVSGGKPALFPVNYMAEDDGIVFSTAQGTKLSALAGGAPVVFEVDDSTAMEHAGWSVLVEGTASEITDEAELDRLRRGPLKSWAVSAAEHWIRVTIESVSGRRIPAS